MGVSYVARANGTHVTPAELLFFVDGLIAPGSTVQVQAQHTGHDGSQVAAWDTGVLTVPDEAGAGITLKRMLEWLADYLTGWDYVTTSWTMDSREQGRVLVYMNRRDAPAPRIEITNVVFTPA